MFSVYNSHGSTSTDISNENYRHEMECREREREQEMEDNIRENEEKDEIYKNSDYQDNSDDGICCFVILLVIIIVCIVLYKYGNPISFNTPTVIHKLEDYDIYGEHIIRYKNSIMIPHHNGRHLTLSCLKQLVKNPKYICWN